MWPSVNMLEKPGKFSWVINRNVDTGCFGGYNPETNSATLFTKGMTAVLARLKSV